MERSNFKQFFGYSNFFERDIVGGFYVTDVVDLVFIAPDSNNFVLNNPTYDEFASFFKSFYDDYNVLKSFYLCFCTQLFWNPDVLGDRRAKFALMYKPTMKLKMIVTQREQLANKVFSDINCKTIDEQYEFVYNSLCSLKDDFINKLNSGCVY